MRSAPPARTLAEQAYTELQRKIMSGSYKAGQRLMPDELASSLAISPTPIKEALALLQRDGLVTSVARRSMSVRMFSPEEIETIYEARALIEERAIACWFDQDGQSSKVLQDLDAHHLAQTAAARKSSKASLAKAIGHDRALHERLVSVTGNSIFREWHRTLLLQTQTIKIYSRDNYDVVRSRDDHSALIAALRKGSRDDALEVLARHLQRSKESVLQP